MFAVVQSMLMLRFIRICVLDPIFIASQKPPSFGQQIFVSIPILKSIHHQV